jgi:hypothetical protein
MADGGVAVPGFAEMLTETVATPSAAGKSTGQQAKPATPATTPAPVPTAATPAAAGTAPRPTATGQPSVA